MAVMNNDQTTVLSKLIIISKIDGALARLRAERKKLEADLVSQTNLIKKTKSEHDIKAKDVAEKKQRNQREEKNLKEEQEKLVARRKALNTLGNYKLQQAAEKEIDHANRQLSVREESLISTLDANEKIETEVKALADALLSQQSEYEKSQTEISEALANYAAREKDHTTERQIVAATIDAAQLAIYDRVCERYPADAVVAVNGSSCSGCFMQVAPQILVQIARGDALMKCRGCARILYVEKSAPPLSVGG